MAWRVTIVVLVLTQTPSTLDVAIAEAERRNLARAGAVNDEEAAHLAFEWLRALNRVIESVSSDPNLATEQHPWFLRQTDTLFYNSIGSNWLINDQLVWNLHAKYRQTTAADDLAWLAASLPQGGECEGYVPCYMATANMQSGEYLRRHPQGVHAADAMRKIVEAIERVERMLSDYPTLFEISHCADLMKELAALEDAVQQASSAVQAHTSEKIHELASRCERGIPALSPSVTLGQYSANMRYVTPPSNIVSIESIRENCCWPKL